MDEEVDMSGWRVEYGLVALLALVAGGCSTTEKNAGDPKAVIETHFTVEPQKAIVHVRPFPEQTPIRVTSHMSDGSRVSRIGFNGWDFNGDGRFDLVEVRTRDGAAQAWVYDFDFDGKVDMTEGVNGGRRMFAPNSGRTRPNMPQTTGSGPAISAAGSLGEPQLGDGTDGSIIPLE